MQKTNNGIINRVLKGIVGLAGTTFINKIINFLSNVLIVRLISKAEFGVFTSANNFVSILILFTGLGTLSGVLQYGSENRAETEKKAYFKYSLLIGGAFDCLLSLGLVIAALTHLFPDDKVAYYAILLMPTILLHFIYEYFNTILRSEKRIKEYIVCVNINSISSALLACVGAYFFGIYGVVLSRNLSFVLGIIPGLIYLKPEISSIRFARRLEKTEKKELLRFSVSCCIIAALNRALYLIDVLLIGYIIIDPEPVAVYKVGTQIPEALEFIPQSILVAIVPYFAEHNTDIDWLKKWTSKLYCFSGLLNLLIVASLIVFSGIIPLFYGEKYTDSIDVFRILSISYFFMATFRQTGTNIISCLRKTDYNVIISAITLCANIVIDIIFIKNWGIIGAAVGTLISTIIASALSLPYVFYLIYSEKGNANLLRTTMGENNE